MSVYVDRLAKLPRGLIGPHWPWPESCHLVADELAELHAFAARLRLRRAWFQDADGKLPHYDLTRRKRVMAIQRGAIEVNARFIVERIRRHRAAEAAR